MTVSRIARVSQERPFQITLQLRHRNHKLSALQQPLSISKNSSSSQESDKNILKSTVYLILMLLWSFEVFEGCSLGARMPATSCGVDTFCKIKGSF
jgi:hypothetical protein